MASKIKVDQLETADGTGTIALQNQLSGLTTASLPTVTTDKLGTGAVLQIVHNSNIAAFTSTSTSLADTNYTISITPKSASSTILVVFSGEWGTSGNGRSGMDIQTNSSGSYATIDGQSSYFMWSEQYQCSMNTITAIETSIGTTNTVTYKARARIISSGLTIYVPMDPPNSHAIAYEIAG